MAATIRLLLSLLILMVKIGDTEQVLKLQNPLLMNCKFDRIYQFGDSLSDTGNCLRESYCGAHSRCRKVPYGMDFYQNASGRCSNGMLIIDFIAIECGLPLLNPYKDENAEFRHGVNFAVVGATALTTESLAQKNIVNPDTNSSLSVQLDWMSSHFQTTCSPAKKLNKSLFLVGEIGGNEFIYGLTQGKTMDESRRMVPEIVQTIIHGVKVSSFL
ncbi:hypothetical protein MTR67_005335 [Solanum verrucosum]|uniref:Acetylajmalan esterase-like n=1 Tax=Solanum verrucosum TaxID=315347 RepID=A0AAF0TFW8_SOLVR|nr:hypothetical protein MTR67_005335 [Solanum verrucosum]